VLVALFDRVTGVDRRPGVATANLLDDSFVARAKVAKAGTLTAASESLQTDAGAAFTARLLRKGTARPLHDFGRPEMKVREDPSGIA
jgi:hypothetical protein